MLHVVFFARVKEQLDCASLELAWDDTLTTVDAVQQLLCARDGGRWGEVLGESNIIRAVNQTVVDGDAGVQDNDEVAFFPPVTGG